MSLPDVPNTLREKYYSVMAGQNDADILPDIETAPSTENRYLDYLARNGGGGGGDVTKAYVDEQDAKKADKVTSATAGNFAGLDSNGNLTDSGKKAADFATADDMTDVQSVIPSTATTSNKLATASDVTGEDISATSTTSPLTDSTDGMAQGLTIYGRSVVVEGEIKSVGDDGLTVTTANSDNTLTTSAEFTTALPLRGVSDTIRDKLTCTAESKQVETVCGEVDLGTLTWNLYLTDRNTFFAPVSGIKNPVTMNERITGLLCENYALSTETAINWINDKSILRYNGNIYIRDTSYSDAESFKSAMSGVMLIYELAEPVTTPLSPAEISAFRGLRTYDSTTNITITDEPEFELDYLKNTENGQAVANIQKDLQEQIDDLGGSFAETVLYDNMNLTVELAANVQCNLSQPYTNFDEIKIEYAYIYTGAGNNKIYPIEYRFSVVDLETIRTSSYNGRKGYLLFDRYLNFVNMYISMDITSTSILTIDEAQISSNVYKHYITKITGIKY